MLCWHGYACTQVYPSPQVVALPDAVHNAVHNAVHEAVQVVLRELRFNEELTFLFLMTSSIKGF